MKFNVIATGAFDYQRIHWASDVDDEPRGPELSQPHRSRVGSRERRQARPRASTRSPASSLSTAATRAAPIVRRSSSKPA